MIPNVLSSCQLNGQGLTSTEAIQRFDVECEIYFTCKTECFKILTHPVSRVK